MSNKEYNKVSVKNNMEVNRNVDVDKVTETNERPKFQGVVSTAPKKIKKSLLSRLITGIVGPDGVSNIGGYVTEEIVKPAVKNIIFDAMTSGISIALFGDRGMANRGARSGGSNVYRPNTNYNNAYPSRPTAERSYSREPSVEPRRPSGVISNSSRYGVEEYVIDDRYDAAHVLTSLTEAADRFGVVSVADYYDLIKADSVFTDNNYGWRHDVLSSARIVPSRGGYIIKFPPVDIL